MSAALAFQHAVESGPLTSRAFEEFFSRLPRHQQAQLEWIRPILDDAHRRLQAEPLTPALVQQTSSKVLGVTMTLAPITRKMFGAASRVGQELCSQWTDKLPTLRAYLASPAALDAAEWALRVVVGFMKWAFTYGAASIDAAVKLGPEAYDQALMSEAGSIIRAQVLVTALLDAADKQVPQQRAVELAEAAYREATHATVALSKEGVHIHPFIDETPAERGARAIRYASRVRDALSDEDVRTLVGARLGPLRS